MLGGRRLYFWRKLVETEVRNARKVRMPVAERVGLWRDGFLSEERTIYNFRRFPREQYLTAYQRYVKTGFLDGEHYGLLYSKLAFYHLMRSIAANTPTLYGLVRDGSIAWIDPPEGATGPADLVGLLRLVGEVVVKPFDGGGGR